VMILHVVTNGHLDDVDTEGISAWEAAFLAFMKDRHPEVGSSIASEKILSDETLAALESAIAEFQESQAGPQE